MIRLRRNKDAAAASNLHWLYGSVRRAGHGNVGIRVGNGAMPYKPFYVMHIKGRPT
jgi:hypothetical protein